MQARMTDGNFKLITMVGIDADTFAGAPAQLSQGRIEELRLPNTVIIDEWGAQLMGRTVVGPDGKTKTVPLKPGDTFEINDIEARIVGICKVRRAFTGGPFVYTTYDRAKAYNLEARRTLSFMLVEPRDGVSASQLCDRIERETALKAWTTDTVIWDWSDRSLAKNTFWWFWKSTHGGFNRLWIRSRDGPSDWARDDRKGHAAVCDVPPNFLGHAGAGFRD